jgi:bifunctional oligoribonuclease and PAP phosphatase NrnA
VLITPGALAALQRAQRVALICHASPDSDCIGGMMALTHALRAQGKDAYPLSPDPVPDYLQHVPGSNAVQAREAELPQLDLVVGIEAASMERMEPIWTNAKARLGAATLLNIDHHMSNTGYGDERIFDPHGASVCEVLYRLLGELGWAIDDTIAYCLLTGVVGDTRSFRTSSTTPDTLRVASELIALGAPLNRVSDSVHKHRTAAELAVWGDVLARTRSEDRILWTSVSDADVRRRGLTIEQIDGIVEFLSDTRDVAASVVFKLHADGRIRLSMRSDGSVDLTKVARLWNGGGHPQASGATLTGVTLEEAEQAVIGAIKRVLRGEPIGPPG